MGGAAVILVLLAWITAVAVWRGDTMTLWFCGFFWLVAAVSLLELWRRRDRRR